MNTIADIKNIVVQNLISQLSNQTGKTGARFISFVYTSKGSGAVTRYTVLLGASKTNIYKKDLEKLKALRPKLTTDIEMLACDELIASIEQSLEKGIGNNDNYTLKGHYLPISKNGEVKLITDKDGNPNIHLTGFVVNSEVIKPGVYKKVNSSPKTIAKDKIEKNLRRGKIRTFSWDVNQLTSISANGMTVNLG